MSANKPRVLIATAREWVSTARMILALASLGCEVDLLSPAGHPARVTGVVSRWTRYNPMRPFRSLERALALGQPAAIMLSDELMMQRVEQLSGKDDRFGLQLRSLVERTGASLAVMQAARSRMTLLNLAREEGIAVPETMAVLAEREVAATAAQLGLPLVLKADGSAGGQGVRVVRSAAEAEAAWRALHEPPSLPRAVKRGLVDHEWGHVRAWLRRERHPVTAQRFVSGGERTGMAVAHRGRMLASVEFDVLHITHQRGPSSAVRIIDDADMVSAMRKLIARLGISGFCGFDFMVDPANGRSLAIEMNARPTQLAHFAAGPGKDLVAAYVREVVGLTHVQDRPAATELDTIALFPQELERDPASPLLSEGHHDVPWDAPGLAEYALKRAHTRLRLTDLRGRGKEQRAESKEQRFPSSSSMR